MHSMRITSRWFPSHALLAALACLVLGQGLAGLAWANPMIAEACLVDIRPAAAAIGSCEEMIQHTQQSGPLVFSAHYYPLYLAEGDELGIGQMTAEFWWPAEWSLMQVLPPAEGAGTLTPLAANRYRLDWSWSQCPRIDVLDHEAFPMGSFVLDVTREGRFECMTVSGSFCYPPGAMMFGGAWGEGQAGVSCSFCDTPCDLAMAQQPSIEPLVLQLEAQGGELATGSLWVWLDEVPDVVYEAGAEWLSFEEVWINPTERQLLVTADTAGLDAGTYETQLSATVVCRTCATVVFTVLPGAQGVPEPDSRAGENPPVPASWGQMKRAHLGR